MRGATKLLLPAALVLAMALGSPAAAAPPDAAARVDKVFEKWDNTRSPGCAVAVAEGGKTVLARAYGMADLERETPNAVDTVFEAGSVSKQFTAAAVMLLALDGKLSLDDSVRKYLPELPDYGAPLTIRHMLTHTSGLRDWGAVVAAAGWPRGTRAMTQNQVLEVVARQRALNFPSGTEFSYSNSGYNLAALLVSRVAGKSFGEFTRERIFVPLGMTRTEWRDDYRRIVKGRALAYAKDEAGWRAAMPNEDAHGNGGLLTTVGDLLRWNAALDAGTLAGPNFAAAEQQAGALADGRPIRYAMGLFVDTWKGVRVIGHDGATGGYRAGLARFPDHGLSVVVLCNAGDASGNPLTRSVAEFFLEGRFAAEPLRTPAVVSAEVLKARAGLYRNPRTMDTATLDLVDGVLKVDGDALVPVDDRVFLYGPSPANRAEFDLDPAGAVRGLRWVAPDGPEPYIRVQPATLTADRRAAYAGRYVAPEAEDAVITIAVAGDDLVAHEGPDHAGKMTPADADIFTLAGTGTLVFDRARSGAITGFRLFSGRLRGLQFEREKESRR